MSSTAYAQDSLKHHSNVNEVIKFIFDTVTTPSITDLSRLGHDVRLDGVTFWRIREAGSFRKCLNPGAVVYFLAVVSGELTLQVQFPEEETFRLKAGDAVSISGMTSIYSRLVDLESAIRPLGHLIFSTSALDGILKVGLT